MKEIKLSPEKITAFMLAVLGLLTLAHLASCLPIVLPGILGRNRPIGAFNFDYEKNLPTLFSTLLLWSGAVLSVLIAYAESGQRARMLQWLGLAAALFYLGTDEFMLIHERIGKTVHRLLNTEGILRYGWLMPYTVLTILFLAVYVPFFLKMPLPVRHWACIAGLLYFSGTLAMGMVGGHHAELFGKDPVFYALATLEELLEFTGTIAFLYALLRYVSIRHPDLQIRIVST